MRKIRQFGEECLREAEAGMKTVKKNKGQATELYNYMKAYKLLADYYELKVLAAASALIYNFGGDRSDQADALRLADEAVERYETAINFIWEHIDKKSGTMKGKWGRAFTLPELIENEKKDREQLAVLFKWPEEPTGADGTQIKHTYQIGADWVE